MHLPHITKRVIFVSLIESFKLYNSEFIQITELNFRKTLLDSNSSMFMAFSWNCILAERRPRLTRRVT